MRAPPWLRTLAGTVGRRLVDWADDPIHGDAIAQRIAEHWERPRSQTTRVSDRIRLVRSER